MEETRSKASSWPLIAAGVVVIVIILAAIRWSLDHPYAIHWDEAQHFNNVLGDVQRLQSGMLLKLAGRILLRGTVAA
jgi:hypothetical protein